MPTSHLSNVLYVATGAAIVLYPLALATSIGYADDPLLHFAQQGGWTVSHAVTGTQKALSFGIGILPGVVIFWVLMHIRKLFDLFRTGRALSLNAAQVIRRTGFGFVGLSLIEFLMIPAQTAVLSFANPAGSRSISIGLSSSMIGALLAAGLLIVIGHALAQAAEVSAENESFV